MEFKLTGIFRRMHPKLRGMLYRHWYQFMARSYQRADWKFMNYGFEPVGDQDNGLVLDQADEVNRLYIQLYDHVVSAVELRDLTVLEVGCGRGGGAEYIMRYKKPGKMIGMDLSNNVINLCNDIYDLDGLSFETGDAESLPFPDQSVDVLINVESSHCYGSIDTFFAEVRRVLRDGGYFLLADFRTAEKADLLRASLQKSGLQLIKETDITENILEALDLDHELKTWFIQDTIHKPLTWLFHQFAGTPGTTIYHRFENRESVYLSFVLQK